MGGKASERGADCVVIAVGFDDSSLYLPVERVACATFPSESATAEIPSEGNTESASRSLSDRLGLRTGSSFSKLRHTNKGSTDSMDNEEPSIGRVGEDRGDTKGAGESGNAVGRRFVHFALGDHVLRNRIRLHLAQFKILNHTPPMHSMRR